MTNSFQMFSVLKTRFLNFQLIGVQYQSRNTIASLKFNTLALTQETRAGHGH